MNGSDLVFDKEILWDGSLRAVRLYVDLGRRQICFAIDGSAINDYYQTEDSRAMAIQSFESHRSEFENMARRMISDGAEPGEQGAYCVDMAMLNKYRP